MKTGRRLRRCAAAAFLFVLALPSAMPQAKKTGTGNSGSSNSKGNTNQPVIAPAPNSQQAPKMNTQTLYVTGRVVQEDGSPLPAGVVIESVCGSRTRKEAYVSGSGSFGFQIGGNSPSDVMPDASDDTFSVPGTLDNRPNPVGFGSAGFGSLSPANLMGCELRAQLAGYRSSAVVFDGFTPMGNLDVGTILMQPMSKVQGSTISLADMKAPKPAKKSLEHADKALKKKNIAEAEKDLKLAVATYPNYATAWYRLGLVYERQRNIGEARTSFTKAIDADSRFVNPYVQLARLAAAEQKWPEVAEITGKALALDSLDFPEAYYLNSIASFFTGKLDDAERSVRKAQRLDPLHRMPKTSLLLADILEQKHDFAGSIEQLQAYLKGTPAPPDADAVQAKIKKLQEESRQVAGNQAGHP